MIGTRLSLALGLAALAAGGCGPDGVGPDCVCTGVFATVDVAVVDEAGTPQSGVAVAVQLARTGETLTVPQWHGDHGLATVIDDSFVARMAGSERLRITGTKADRTFSAEFVVGVDEPCRCHVFKLDGPASVVLR